jgi:hypothetical protein
LAIALETTCLNACGELPTGVAATASSRFTMSGRFSA